MTLIMASGIGAGSVVRGYVRAPCPVKLGMASFRSVTRAPDRVLKEVVHPTLVLIQVLVIRQPDDVEMANSSKWAKPGFERVSPLSDLGARPRFHFSITFGDAAVRCAAELVLGNRMAAPVGSCLSAAVHKQAGEGGTLSHGRSLACVSSGTCL